MEDSKKIAVMSNIMRAAHFEWRRAALACAPGLDPMTLVLAYWREVAADTARYYCKRIDPNVDVAGQVARLFVDSSVAMNEDAEYRGQAADGAHIVAHKGCPWLDWHRRLGLLEEDQAGCDHWLAETVAGVNAALGTRVRCETVGTMPGGEPECVRRFWSEEA